MSTTHIMTEYHTVLIVFLAFYAVKILKKWTMEALTLMTCIILCRGYCRQYLLWKVWMPVSCSTRLLDQSMVSRLGALQKMCLAKHNLLYIFIYGYIPIHTPVPKNTYVYACMCINLHTYIVSLYIYICVWITSLYLEVGLHFLYDRNAFLIAFPLPKKSESKKFWVCELHLLDI